MLRETSPLALHVPTAPQALVRRRVRAGDARDDIVQLRVPPAPIPVSWGRTAAPYVPPHLRGQRQMAGELGGEGPALRRAYRRQYRAAHLQGVSAGTWKQPSHLRYLPKRLPPVTLRPAASDGGLRTDRQAGRHNPAARFIMSST